MAYDKYSNKYISSLGEPNLLNKRYTWNQKSKNDFQWAKDCAEFIDGQYYAYGDTKNIARIQMNYDLANGQGEAEMREFGQHIIPELIEEGFGDMDIYGNIQHHPIIQQVYSAMVGEQQLRPLTPLALDTSGFSMTQRKRKRLELSQQYLQEQVIAPKLAQIKAKISQEYATKYGVTDLFKLQPEEQMQMQSDIDNQLKIQTPKEIHEYMRKDYKSPGSIQAQKILDFVMSDLDIKYITDENFKNLIIAGEEIYRVGIRNGRSYIEMVNPMGFYYMARPNSLFIEDGVAWKYEQFVMHNDIYAWHGAEIGNSTILKDKLELITGAGQRRKFGEPMPQWVTEVQAGNTHIVDNAPSLNTLEGQEYVKRVLGGSHAQKGRVSGDVRYVHCAWKGLRKLKQIKRYNSDKDKIKSIFIDESYVFNPIKVDENGYRDIEEFTLWAPELWGDVIIDKDVHLETGPIEYQYKSLENPWDIKGPYIGGQYSKLMNNTKKISPIDPAKPWQYKFNLQMARIHELEATDIGKVLHMSLQSKPAEWSFKKYLMMMKYGKLAITDTTQEGYIPGMENLIKQIDLGTLDKLAGQLQYLEYLNHQLILSMNYNPSRLGLQGPTVPVTNNQQNIVQSSYQTNDIFSFHNKIVENLLNVTVDVTKVALRENESIRGFILDDLSIADLELNWELIDNSEINVKITNSSQEYQNVQEVKQLLQPFVQNQMLTAPDAIRIGFSKSKAEIMNIAENAQEMSEQRMQQSQKAQQDMIARQEQMAMQMEKMRQDFELEKQRRDHESDLVRTVIDSSKFAQQMDADGNKILDTITLEQQKHRNEMEKFNEEVELEREKQAAAEKLEEKKFALEKEVAKTKLEIERIKAKKKPAAS